MREAHVHVLFLTFCKVSDTLLGYTLTKESRFCVLGVGTTKLQKSLSTAPGVLAACTVSCLLWGSAFPCVKIGYELFGIQSSDLASLIAFAGARFLLAGVMVIVGTSVASGHALVPKKRDWRAIGALSFFQTIAQYSLFYIGLSRTSGVTSSIIEASNSLLCVLLAAIVFRTERLTSRKVLGCAVGFAGVILVNIVGEPGAGLSFSLGGEGLVLLSTVCAAVSSNLAKGFSADHDPVLLSGWQFALAGAVMLACGLGLGGHVAPVDPARPLPAVALLVYLGFISAAAYSLWTITLACNPVSRVAVFGFINPVAGVILSALLLGEAHVLDPVVAAIALVMVSAGIVIVNRAPQRPAKKLSASLEARHTMAAPHEA